MRKLEASGAWGRVWAGREDVGERDGWEAGGWEMNGVGEGVSRGRHQGEKPECRRHVGEDSAGKRHPRLNSYCIPMGDAKSGLKE
jgi:hypothetical protein